MKAIIIDDEQQARIILREELSSFKELEIIGEADHVQDAVLKIQSLQPDIIFLDIQLGQGSGFDVLDQINLPSLKVVFVSAYDQFAIEAFKFNALHYILKPIHHSDIAEIMDRLTSSTDNLANTRLKAQVIRNNKLPIVTNDGISFHDIQRIVRCQGDSNYTLIHFTDSSRIMASRTLRDFEAYLTPCGFERVHKSHLVNLLHIEKYVNRDGGYLIMSDQSTVPISQRKKSQFLKLINDQYKPGLDSM